MEQKSAFNFALWVRGRIDRQYSDFNCVGIPSRLWINPGTAGGCNSFLGLDCALPAKGDSQPQIRQEREIADGAACKWGNRLKNGLA